MLRLISYIKGIAARSCREFPCAVATFRQLEEQSPLRKNAHVMAALGITYYLQGDEMHALPALQRVRLCLL